MAEISAKTVSAAAAAGRGISEEEWELLSEYRARGKEMDGKRANTQLSLAGLSPLPLLRSKPMLSAGVHDLPDDDEDEHKVVPGDFARALLQSTALMAKFRGAMQRCVVDLFDVKFWATNSVAGKYIIFMNPGVAAGYTMTNVANAQEWSSISALFDEFFIKSCSFRYEPINKYSAAYAGGGTLANLSSTLLAIAGIQHGTGAYADSAATVAQIAAQTNHKLVNTGERFTFTWKNNERFDWKAPLGDQTTVQTTQSWCQVGNTAKYGGFVFGAVPSVTAASASPTAFPQSVNLGTVIIRFKVAFRVRA